jgi:adenosylcobinamide-GDP ribazoletransferase
MLDIISFLTQIPIRKEVKLEEVAAKTYLFPFAAVLIGLLVSVVAFVGFRFLVTELASLLTLLIIYLITGLMHLDGLADFFDGIMATGSRSEKRKAMKDAKIGIAGLFAVIFVLLVVLFAIETVCATTSNFDFRAFYTFASVFIIAEVSAKLSMNTCMIVGKRVEDGGGMGALFIRSSTRSRYVVALLSSAFIALICTIFTDPIRFFIAFTGIVVAFVVVWIAKKKFGVVSGDVIGASNELARCITLLIWAIIVS